MHQITYKSWYAIKPKQPNQLRKVRHVYFQSGYPLLDLTVIIWILPPSPENKSVEVAFLIPYLLVFYSIEAEPPFFKWIFSFFCVKNFKNKKKQKQKKKECNRFVLFFFFFFLHVLLKVFEFFICLNRLILYNPVCENIFVVTVFMFFRPVVTSCPHFLSCFKFQFLTSKINDKDITCAPILYHDLRPF